ncbi:hypothetical protein H696_02227 [Fonticula alba]|uniref:LisH domain-containing protein n=1 Tax=Fonticula alba TaxID=691883 RepID=A0A058ZAC1_FONAL|nr:hypothetical protein H696_02227 [Fonticula alba]KCV71279.1 hypothetical protein H696_02227 [Fonticula alba]|eukprot:XP_009494402.1 hypothetical protein H696_02227 [Fonticula alba]
MDPNRVLGLVQQFLFERGLHQTLAAFEEETGGLLDAYDQDMARTQPGGQLVEMLNTALQARVEAGLAEMAIARSLSPADAAFLAPHPAGVPGISLLRNLAGLHGNNILCVAVQPPVPDGSQTPDQPRYLATGGADQQVILTNLATGLPEKYLHHHRAGVLSVVFNPRRPDLLISTSMDATHHLIDASADMFSAVAQSWADHKKFLVRAAFKFSPCGGYLGVLTDRSRLIIFRAHSAEQVANIYGIDTDPLGMPSYVWHPSGKVLFAVTNDRNIACVILATQSICQIARHHRNVVRGLAFDATTERLYACSYDNSVSEWGVTFTSNAASPTVHLS